MKRKASDFLNPSWNSNLHPTFLDLSLFTEHVEDYFYDSVLNVEEYLHDSALYKTQLPSVKCLLEELTAETPFSYTSRFEKDKKRCGKFGKNLAACRDNLVRQRVSCLFFLILCRTCL